MSKIKEIITSSNAKTDQKGKLVSLGLKTGSYSNIYFPFRTTEKTGMFSNQSYLSASSEHHTEIQITSIS